MGERIRHIFVEKLHAFKVAAADKPTSLCRSGKMVLGQVLHLYNASSPTTGPVGTIELKHSTSTTIGADCLFHRLILLYGRFGQLLPEKENLLSSDGAVLSISATSFFPRESTSSPLSESHCFICCTELGLSKAVSFFMAAVRSHGSGCP